MVLPQEVAQRLYDAALPCLDEPSATLIREFLDEGEPGLAILYVIPAVDAAHYSLPNDVRRAVGEVLNLPAFERIAASVQDSFRRLTL